MHKRYRSELRSHGQPGRLSLRSLQRKKRIFGLPGIIAPATTSTTITMTSSIFPSQFCPHHQTASAQLTSSCREGKLRKCRRALKEGNAESVKRFSETDSE